MDGWLYVSIGDKGIPKMTRKETDRGSVHVAEGNWRHSKEGHHISLEGGGVIRFRPDGGGLEVYASGTRNHLDAPIDAQDRIFVRDNTDDGDGWWTRLMMLPRGGFQGYPWAFKAHPGEVIPPVTDFKGGSPCGGFVYADDGLPATYRNRVFHCEWGKGKVYAVALKPNGAGFDFADEITFMDPDGTGLKDFRPFAIRPTADGRGFYVSDWGYSGWSANVKAGRLWKVTYTGSDVTPAPRLTGVKDVAKLLTGLGHPAHTERVRIQRALIAMAAENPAIVQTILAHEPTTPEAKSQYLWLCRNLNETLRAIDRARAWSKDESANVRMQAARVLGQLQAPVDLLPLVDDADPTVRLAAILGLAESTSWGNRANDITAHLIAKTESDPFIRHAIVKAIRYESDGEIAGTCAESTGGFGRSRDSSRARNRRR